MEEIGAPSIYQLTKFIYLYNNPDDRDNIEYIDDNHSNNILPTSFTE